ncbi:hypothetical protein [uncultured Roseibium sp.]|uniref:hypothetical protein n=1 Tax=uncultured Roseibium sp. TaxID=1936171 RepID=UPI00260ED4A0|nr:hypothetical protein [uncultured Roseibium sp.]
MFEAFRRIVSQFLRSSLMPICAVVLASGSTVVASAQETGNAENQGVQNHILGIGICPPWNPQSPEMCKNSLDKVISALAPRLDASPGRTHLLVNEGASASALKLKATELSNNLGPDDRLIIYANLPLSSAEVADTDTAVGHVLELWADQSPETASEAIAEGVWMSAPAFAAMIHAIRAGEVVLILDTNNSYAVNLDLLDEHSVDHENRPEALVTSSGRGQMANYSADRTISLFAKHLSLALGETEGTLLDVMTAASQGTRQAAIPICASLKEHQGTDSDHSPDCTQVPEVHDPDSLLSQTLLAPLPES